MPLRGLLDTLDQAITTTSGLWLIFSDDGPSTYRLLKDHYVDGLYLRAGETVGEDGRIPIGWTPTDDVDPLNESAVQAFYAVGPSLGGVINSQWQNAVIARPVTYWYQIAPQYWALSGLGSDQTAYPPIHAQIGRVE